MPSPDVRAVAAALAHDLTRRVYAAHVLGTVEALTDSPAKVRRAIETLERAGLLAGDGSATGDVFRQLLAADTTPRVEGPRRFLDADGRITRIPRADDDRRALFALVIDRVLAEGEVQDEREVSRRIAMLHDDVTALRRDLVDAGFLRRAPDGSSYRRGAGDGGGR